MNEKIECLKLALEYSKIWNEKNNSRYQTENGIVSIAKIFYEFVKEDK